MQRIQDATEQARTATRGRFQDKEYATGGVDISAIHRSVNAAQRKGKQSIAMNVTYLMYLFRAPACSFDAPIIYKANIFDQWLSLTQVTHPAKRAKWTVRDGTTV
jgi:hypothetical protein